jgi:hypothetical protein
MRLVLLNQFFRDEAFGGAPDEIHFGVDDSPSISNMDYSDSTHPGN